MDRNYILGSSANTHDSILNTDHITFHFSKSNSTVDAKWLRASLTVISRHLGGRGRPQGDSTWGKRTQSFLVLYDVKQIQAAEVSQRRTAVSSKCFKLYYTCSDCWPSRSPLALSIFSPSYCDVSQALSYFASTIPLFMHAPEPSVYTWYRDFCILVIHIKTIFFLKVGVGLVPKRGCLLTLAYYAFPRWYEFGERRWNDIDRGKPKNPERNLSQCHFVYLKSHMGWPGSELGPRRWETGN
jgi:hypothetical protein